MVTFKRKCLVPEVCNSKAALAMSVVHAIQ